MQVPDLLQWVANGMATGTLVIANGVVEKKIFFRDGQIIAAGSSDPREYLGHFLVGHGYISEHQLSAAMAKQEEKHVLLGKILVDEGYISPEDLDRMLQLKSREGIYELFAWQDGEFRFLDGKLPAYSMVPLSIGVTGILLEAMQRMDEWEGIRQAVPSAEVVPVTMGEILDGPGLSDSERTVLAAVNDDRSAADICLHTHQSEYAVSKALKRLVELGWVKVVRPRQLRVAEVVPQADPAALLKLAWRLFKEGDYQRALRHARAAATLEPDSAGVRKHVAGIETALRETVEAEGVKLDRVPKLRVEVSQLTSLSLSPEEGFILTRINGNSTVSSLLKITPVATLDAMLVFYRLMRAGYIELERASQGA
jgi:hypothetical protein